MTWLRLHGLAMAQALRRLAASPITNAFSILVLAVALSLPVLATMALSALGTATASLDTQPHVDIYLTPEASPEDAKRVEQALRSHPVVSSVRFIPKAQAFDELKATTHLAEILATLERNPLPDAFSVRLKNDAGSVEALRQDWAKLPKVDAVSADFEWAERLSRWVRFGDHLLLLVALFLAAAVAFIVGHLIRLQVLTRREEIEVSQLVGATAADVRRPFAYHGILQGLLAGTAAMGLAVALGAWAAAEMRALAPSYATELKVLFPGPMPWAVVVFGSAVLGFIGASVAVGRELRRFSADR